MGRVWVARGELVGTTGEIVGFKAGLALTRDELGEQMSAEYQSLWQGDDEEVVTVRAEEYEELIAEVLHGVGNIPSPRPVPPTIALFHKYKHEPDTIKVLLEVAHGWTEDMRAHVAAPETGERTDRAYDPGPLGRRLKEKHGLLGPMLLLELLDQVQLALHRSPWSSMRRMEWSDQAELSDLFQSESLETAHGKFIDQRFIDYLNQNFGRIDEMNWRKFEALTCEFFVVDPICWTTDGRS